MEANPTDLCSSSSSSNSDSASHTEGEICRQNADKAKAEKVVSAFAECENIWRTASEKQFMISRLRGEQMKVSDSFSRFYEISRQMEHSISENMESYHRFAEISEQVQILAHFLNEFELKLKTSEKIVLDLIGDIRAHLSTFRQGIDHARESQNMDGLLIPTLDWIETVPDPEVETLVDEWDLMQLDDKMTEYLRQVGELVDLNGMEMEADVEDFE